MPRHRTSRQLGEIGRLLPNGNSLTTLTKRQALVALRARLRPSLQRREGGREVGRVMRFHVLRGTQSEVLQLKEQSLQLVVELVFLDLDLRDQFEGLFVLPPFQQREGFSRMTSTALAIASSGIGSCWVKGLVKTTLSSGWLIR